VKCAAGFRKYIVKSLSAHIDKRNRVNICPTKSSNESKYERASAQFFLPFILITLLGRNSVQVRDLPSSTTTSSNSSRP